MGATLLFASVLGWTPSCSDEPPELMGGGTGGAGGEVSSATGGTGTGADDGFGPDLPPGAEIDPSEPQGPTLDDFPSDPVIEGDAPSNAPELFDMDPVESELAAAPCMITPEDGTLFPRNWLRPRIEFTPAGDHNLFEIVMSTEGLETPLRIYTTEPESILEEELWMGLRNTIIDEPIQVRVRSARIDEEGDIVEELSEASIGTFVIAPVTAPGQVVYWALPDGYGSGGVLKGFQIGDEGVVTVLEPPQVAEPPPQPVNGQGQAPCVGCHSATPDGSFVGLSTGPVSGYQPNTFFRNTVAGVTASNTGSVPSWMDESALEELQSLRGVIAFSAGHWSEGERMALLTHDGDQLLALNLSVPVGSDNPSVVARSGDPNGVTAPTWSHDGSTIVYTSIGGNVVDGRPGTGAMDLYSVPYGGGQGGAAAPLVGANTSDYVEYYAAFSPDDAWLAYTRAPAGANAYDQANAEVFVIPAEGGTAVRLRANDPPLCSESTSPGVTNSWPKWSPLATPRNGKTYYFLTFSSTRRGAHQLYVTAIVVEGGDVTTYPALHLWNQPEDEGNHTPAWEHFDIPPVRVR